jgi:hypothetical protein
MTRDARPVQLRTAAPAIGAMDLCRRADLPDASDVPGAADLLRTARAVVLDALLPALPAERHYEARMVAHALGIVARELEAAPLEPALRRTLHALAGGSHDGDATPPLARLGAALARRIRAGDFAHDAQARSQLHAALVAWTAARLAIADPRAAGARDEG